jgi:formylmethanofuran dehydrogenase subunit E
MSDKSIEAQVERVDHCSQCGKRIVTQPASFVPEQPVLCQECLLRKAQAAVDD